MSLVRNHTGFHFYPLTAGSNDNPSFSQTSPTTFELKNLPIIYGNDQPYYVYGILLTFYGDVDQPAAAGSTIDRNQCLRALIDSLEVRNAWHGTPVSANHVKGSMLQIIEPLSMGYALPQLSPGPISAADGDYNFEINVWVPLSMGYGEKPHHTAQLALLYKQAQLVINPAAASVLNGISTGAVFEQLSVRAAACMLPEPELRLGPVPEFIDYQSPASSNQSQIALDSFGNVTAISGTLPNAGIAWAGALSNINGLPGSFAVQNVTRYSNPWRGQVDIQQIPAFVMMQLAAMGNTDFAARAQADQRQAVNGSRTQFPYSELAGDQSNDWKLLQGLLFFPLVTPAFDLELTKLQTAKGTQSYFLTGPTFSGTNHTLVQHVRSFDDNKREDAVRQIVDSGLADKVLGRSTNLGWVPKLTQKNDSIAPDKLRYLPFRLVRQEPKRVVSPQALIGGRR